MLPVAGDLVTVEMGAWGLSDRSFDFLKIYGVIMIEKEKAGMGDSWCIAAYLLG